jgi:hypothetical protein
MKNAAWFGVILIVAAAEIASAEPVIDVGEHLLLPDATQTIAIYSSGDETVQGLNFYVQIGDGGEDNGGTDTKPIITTVDIVGSGTLFQGNNTGQSTIGSKLLWAASTTTDAGTVSDNGLLAYVTIDTTGTKLGDVYALSLTGTGAGIFGDPGLDTDFAGIAATITNGSIRIVPEPGAFVLLGGLLAFLPVVLWRCRRKSLARQ